MNSLMLHPMKFTGAKARRFLVYANDNCLPPWGEWTYLSNEESKRRTFTRMRAAINEAISPHEIDHVAFTHKELKQLFESGVAKGVDSTHATRLKNILALLETAESTDDMDLPGLRLHQLKGKRKGTWAVTVSGNRRTTFKIQNGDAFDINYEDYH